MKVFIGILLLLILMLLVPVVVVFEADPQLRAVVKYYGFKKPLFLKEEDGEVEAKKPKKSTKEKKPKEKKETVFKIKDIWSLYQKLQHRLSPTVRKLLRRTSVGKFRLRIVVVGSNAYDTAIRFGRINEAVFSVFALLDRIVTLRAEQINIIPGFGAEKSEKRYSGIIKLIPIVVLIAAAQLGFWTLLATFPLLRSHSKREKGATKSNTDEIAEDGKEDKNGKETPAQ